MKISTNTFILLIKLFKGKLLNSYQKSTFSKTAIFEPLEKVRPGQYYAEPQQEAPLIPDHQVWSLDELADYIDEQVGPNVFDKFIKREIHDVVIDAVKRNSYHNRQLDGCFELYGADIGKKHLLS